MSSGSMLMPCWQPYQFRMRSCYMGFVFKDDSITMIFCLNYNLFDVRFGTTVVCGCFGFNSRFLSLALYSCASFSWIILFYFQILSTFILSALLLKSFLSVLFLICTFLEFFSYFFSAFIYEFLAPPSLSFNLPLCLNVSPCLSSSAAFDRKMQKGKMQKKVVTVWVFVVNCLEISFFARTDWQFLCSCINLFFQLFVIYRTGILLLTRCTYVKSFSFSSDTLLSAKCRVNTC